MTATFDRDKARKVLYGTAPGYPSQEAILDALAACVVDDLDGAAERGHEGSYPATPGQFAARWNARSEDERAKWVSQLVNASERSIRCFQMDHEGAVEQLHQAQTTLARIEALCDEAVEWQEIDPPMILVSEVRAILRGEGQ